ncbi:glycoside hydrolase family 32 protein [Streptomyces tremellae]|uniref:beta-fructofuranosidase n=1 Tax=Streptomyces tremellae TaxID=1124239 RepID=A0ABP7FTQ5_9ACTN
MTEAPAPFHRPADGWFGDVMPILVDGVYHVFYCHLDRDDTGAPGVCKPLTWAHLTTRDFVHFEEHPRALDHGGPDDVDLLAGAGSVTGPVDGTYYAYYVGINPRRTERGEPEQVVLRATSQDLANWTKDEDFVFEADPRWYERDAWRDPFLYRHGDRWRMLLCARSTEGPAERRGAIGLAESDDLLTWRALPPLYTPGTTYAPECPEIFTLAGREYLVYSTYSDRFATRYRYREPGQEAWRRPDWDALDTNDVYAMNTVADETGERRHLIGWLATRAGDTDAGHRQWGGDLVAHELVPRPDGTLGVAPPEASLARFSRSAARAEPRAGSWTVTGDAAAYEGDGFGWCSLGACGHTALLEADVHLDADCEEFGIALRARDDFSAAYLLRFEPRHGRVVFDRRPHTFDGPFDHDKDRSYVSAPDHEIERPLPRTDGTVRVRITLEGSVVSVYVDDIALTTRGYDLTGGEFGLYAAQGTARFSSLAVGAL